MDILSKSQIGDLMFNLFVRYVGWVEGHNVAEAGRIFEGTQPHIVERFRPNGILDLDTLRSMPALIMSESQGAQTPHARVASIPRAHMVGNNVSLEFVYDAAVPPLTNQLLERFAAELGMERWEFTRSHWAVKDADLYRFALRHLPPIRPATSAFALPPVAAIDPSFASIMMPFGPSFNSVYAAIQGAAAQAGYQSLRADDFWQHAAIIQDIVALIDRSAVVICDCSGRNPNVFYEIGIAHTLGREVILITQSQADIPFDLQHLRYIPYLNNGEGLARLTEQLRARLADLAGRAVPI
jgi:hypothetical protein